MKLSEAARWSIVRGTLGAESCPRVTYRRKLAVDILDDEGAELRKNLWVAGQDSCFTPAQRARAEQSRAALRCAVQLTGVSRWEYDIVEA